VIRNSNQGEEAPVWGDAGASERAIPLGEGEMIALSGSTVPNGARFLAGPLTPSLLVRTANPRHDPWWR
jgi:hypothetical protein